MRFAEPRLEPAGQRLVGEDRVEMHRRLGHAHRVALGRDAGMEIGQRLAVREPFGFRREALDELQQAIGAVDEAGERRGRRARRGSPLIEPALGAGRVVLGRQEQQRQKISALEMRAFLLELRLALHVDERRDGIGEVARRIVLRRIALRLDEDRPAGAKTPQRIVEPRRRADELGLRRAVEIGAAKARRALEGAVLVEDHARRDERRPGQEVGEALRLLAIFGEVQHQTSPQAPRCAG